MTRSAPEAPLLGRETALRRLDADGHRLVCVLGPPGVGKSRLCRAWVAGRGDDAALAEVSRASDANDLRAIVGRTLSLTMVSAEPAADDEIARALAARGAFALVLDDVTATGSALDPLAVWLTRAPDLRVVTTSRRRLGLASETLFPLPPLALPDGPEFPPTSAALRLFIDRAREARPELELDRRSVALAARLVTELDGLPLAIELCAARCRLLGLAELLQRIEAPPERASGLFGSANETTKKLEDAIIASFDLLTPQSKRQLTCLSVFSAGFDVAAAEAVLAGSEGSAIDALESFLDQSLLSPEASLRATDSPRFRLLGPIRDAACALAPDARPAALDRFAGYFARTGIRLAQRAIHGDADAGRKLSLDRDNLIAAHRGAAGQGRRSRAMRTALALGALLWSEGALTACLEYLSSAVAFAGDERLVDGLIALAHGGRAVALLGLGRLDEAARAKHQALALEPGIEDQALRARVTRQIAKVTLAEADWVATEQALSRSLAYSLAAGDEHGAAHSRIALGELAYYRDDLSGALTEFEAARASLAAQQSTAGVALASYHVGQVLTELGRNVEAHESLQVAIAGFEAARNRRGQANALAFVGILEQAAGRPEEALAAFDRALHLSRITDFRRAEGNLLGYRAGCLLEAGQEREAIREYTAAVDCLRESGFSVLPFLYGGLAVALARRGDHVAARAALDSASHRREPANGQPFAARTLAIHAAHVEWLHQRPDAAALQAAQAALAVAGPIQSDVRFARRLLEQALPDAALAEAAAPSATGMGLQIARSGRWFETRDVGRVNLQRRRALRACLAELVRLRIESPGVALGVSEIVALGWPGESIHPEAARERVYTAITTLRRFGLRESLRRRDDGYLIDPCEPVELVDDGP